MPTLAPNFTVRTLTVSKNAAKLGLAVEIAAADEAVMEAQEQSGAAMSGPIPF